MVIVQRAAYINDELAGIWVRNFTTVGLQLVLSLALLWLILHWFIYTPIRRIRAMVNVARLANDEAVDMPKNTFLDPLLQELGQIQKDLAEVRHQVNQQTLTAGRTLSRRDAKQSRSKAQD
jgi:hypothetical protein